VAHPAPAGCNLALRVTRPLTVLAALAGCGVLFAGAAQAKPLDGTYRGKTSQDRKTVAKVKDGLLQSVSFRWVGHCRAKGYVWGPMKTTWTNAPNGPIEQHGNRFTDEGKIVWRAHGERAVLRSHLAGRISGDRITGVQSVKIRVTKSSHGRDYCTSKVRWSAKRVRG